MSEPGPPEGMDPQETSQPADQRPTEDPGARAEAEAGPAPEAAPAQPPASGTETGSGAASSAPAEAADATSLPDPDPVRDALVERLRKELGDAILESAVQNGEAWVRVDRREWRRTAEHLKDSGFTYFCFLSGIDWLRNPELSNRYEQVFTPEQADEGEAAEAGGNGTVESRVAGGDTRFQVFIRLYDVNRRVGITVKADLDDQAPSVESIVPVYRGADWHERETWEMFGFDFVGHPGLRHLYLPSGFEGFPLRKDFPLLARVVKPWPGLVDKEPVPGEDEEEVSA